MEQNQLQEMIQQAISKRRISNNFLQGNYLNMQEKQEQNHSVRSLNSSSIKSEMMMNQRDIKEANFYHNFSFIKEGKMKDSQSLQDEQASYLIKNNQQLQFNQADNFKELVQFKLLWADPPGYKNQDIQWSEKLQLFPQIDFLDRIDSLEDRIKRILKESNVELDFERILATRDQISLMGSSNVLLIAQHCHKGIPEKQSENQAVLTGRCEQVRTMQMDSLPVKTICEKLKKKQFQFIFIASCNSFELAKELYQSYEERVHIVCSRQDAELNMEVVERFMNELLELLAQFQTFCDAYESALKYLHSTGITIGKNNDFNLYKFPHAICNDCRKHKKYSKLMPTKLTQDEFEKAIKRHTPVYNKDIPQCVQPEYLYWNTYSKVMQKFLDSNTKIVQAIDAKQPFMENFFILNKKRESFKYGMLYLNSKHFTDALSILYEIYKGLIEALDLNANQIQHINAENLCQIIAQLFKNYFPPGQYIETKVLRIDSTLVDQYLPEIVWSFCIFLNDIKFKNQLEKLKFEDILNRLIQLIPKNLYFIIKAEENFNQNRLSDFSGIKVTQLSKIDSFLLFERTYESLCKKEKAERILYKQIIHQKDQLQKFYNDTKRGSSLRKRYGHLDFWMDCKEEPPCLPDEEQNMNIDKNLIQSIHHYICNCSHFLCVTNYEEESIKQMAKLYYETKDLLKTFRIILEQKAKEHEEQYRSRHLIERDYIACQHKLRKALLQEYGLEQKMEHLALIFLTIRLNPFRQALTLKLILSILQLTNYDVAEQNVESMLIILLRLNYIDTVQEEDQMEIAYRAKLDISFNDTQSFAKIIQKRRMSRTKIDIHEIFMEAVGEVNLKKFASLFLQYFIQQMSIEILGNNDKSISKFILENRENIQDILIYLRNDQVSSSQMDPTSQSNNTHNQQPLQNIQPTGLKMLPDLSSAQSKSDFIMSLMDQHERMVTRYSARSTADQVQSQTIVQRLLSQCNDHEALMQIGEMLNVSHKEGNGAHSDELDSTIIFSRLINQKSTLRKTKTEEERKECEAEINESIKKLMKTEKGKQSFQRYRVDLKQQAQKEVQRRQEIELIKDMKSVLSHMSIRKNQRSQALLKISTSSQIELNVSKLTQWEEGFILLATLVVLNKYPDYTHNAEINRLNGYKPVDQDTRKQNLRKLREIVCDGLPNEIHINAMLQAVLVYNKEQSKLKYPNLAIIQGNSASYQISGAPVKHVKNVNVIKGDIPNKANGLKYKEYYEIQPYTPKNEAQ
ncbi:hypothetical protein FGO68_gene10454 [Halteria grandinella]|uniref:Uncharacterized protein n=1 Tax=Halteria grandinella TaxID=5974 RepID=A0A8J8NHR7_HALGN|nr:hypothetical protein FGO68_gene10454 [Halteria grandinella]